MTQVRCTVDSCSYWDQQNNCRASSILVTSDAFGAQHPGGVDGTGIGTLETTPVTTNAATCCKTFARRGSRAAGRDDVTSRS
jgi:hypothetical protein